MGLIHDEVTTYMWCRAVLLGGEARGWAWSPGASTPKPWGSDSRSEGEPEQHPVRCHIVTPAIESHQHGANYGESMKVRSAVAAATIAGMALVLSACASSSTSTPTESAASDLGVAAADVAE